jgi:NDP-sugar pyrophosphorylase family protein
MPVQPHTALILAAGRGIRLMPLTAECPKPMVPVGGRPILEHILLGLRTAGVDEAVIVTGYCGDTIEAYFGGGDSVGVRLRYRAQTKLGGTADAMLATTDMWGDEPFVLLWGDILFDPANYTAVLDRYANDPAQPACVLAVNWVDDPWAGGAVYRDGDRITHLAEKLPKGTAGTHWNIAGLMVLAPSLWRYLVNTARPEQGEFYITQVLDEMIRSGETIVAHELIGDRMHFSFADDITAADTDPRLAAWAATY